VVAAVAKCKWSLRENPLKSSELCIMSTSYTTHQHHVHFAHENLRIIGQACMAQTLRGERQHFRDMPSLWDLSINIL
jgi:hypothetical protein